MAYAEDSEACPLRFFRGAVVGMRPSVREKHAWRARKRGLRGKKRAHEAGEEVPRTERRAKARREVLSRRGRRDGMQGRGRKRADHGKKARSAPGRESFPGGNAGARPGALRRSAPAASGKVRGTWWRASGKTREACLVELSGNLPGEMPGGRERYREGCRGGAPGSGSGMGVGQGRRPLSASGTGQGRTGERLALRRQ